MNYETAFLAALDALIVAMGGAVPTVATLNHRQAVLLRLDALVSVAGGAPPVTAINYEGATLARWAAAIAALGGTVPTVRTSNYREVLLLHVQALQAARGVSVAISGPNFEEALLGLLSDGDVLPLPALVTTAPAIADQDYDGAKFSTTSSSPGTFYAAVYPDGTATPSAADIKAGTGALTNGSVVLSADTQGVLTLSGLENTNADKSETPQVFTTPSYEVFCLVEDGSGNQSEVYPLELAINPYDPPMFPTTYNYYVSTTGNNANAGTSAGAAFANLAPLKAILENSASAGQTIDISVAAGTYTETHLILSASHNPPGTFRLWFENGVSLNGNNSTDLTLESCFEAQGTGVILQLICAGTDTDRLQITNYTNNGLSTRNAGQIYAWNVRIDNCFDCVTSHSNNDYFELYNCDARDFGKGGFINSPGVYASRAYNCEFVDNDTATSEVLFSVAGHSFYDCRVKRAVGQSSIARIATGGPTTTIQIAKFVRCNLGEVGSTRSLELQGLVSGVQRIEITDSFVNQVSDGWNGLTMLRCWGYIRQRARTSTGTQFGGLIRRCCFVGDVGLDNYAFWGQVGLANGGLPTLLIEDTIFTKFSNTVLGFGLNATEEGHWNTQCDVDFCNFFDNTTNNTAGIAASITNSITTDPLLPAAAGTTLNRADYAIPSNSPCVGAGTGGGDIGFQA